MTKFKCDNPVCKTTKVPLGGGKFSEQGRGVVKEFRNWTPIMDGKKVRQATPHCLLCGAPMVEVK